MSGRRFEFDLDQLTPKQKENLRRSQKRVDELNNDPSRTATFAINKFSLLSVEELRSFFRRDDSLLPKVPFQCGGKCWEIRPKPLVEEHELEYYGKVDSKTFREIANQPKDDSAKNEMWRGIWTYREIRFLFLIGAIGNRRKSICEKIGKWEDDHRRGFPNIPSQFGGKGHLLSPKDLDVYEPELEFFSQVDPISYKEIHSAPERDAVVCDDFRFDIRRKWPQCGQIISEVRDQSNCNCCYAVAGAGVLTDRFCIAMAKRGWPVPPARHGSSFFSAADIMQCGRHSWEDACRGDFSYNVWRFLHEIGIVSGHHFNRGGCKPFPFPPMAFLWPFTYRAECLEQCVVSPHQGEEEYSTVKAKTINWHTLSQNVAWEQVIKDEILHNGSVPVDLNTNEDFVNYDGGILEDIRVSSLGGHVVRLIGYGRVNCTDGRLVKYWLGVNSWNVGWGENGGFFRIARGINAFGMESRDISFGHIELP